MSVIQVSMLCSGKERQFEFFADTPAKEQQILKYWGNSNVEVSVRPDVEIEGIAFTRQQLVMAEDAFEAYLYGDERTYRVLYLKLLAEMPEHLARTNQKSVGLQQAVRVLCDYVT